MLATIHAGTNRPKSGKRTLVMSASDPKQTSVASTPNHFGHFERRGRTRRHGIGSERGPIGPRIDAVSEVLEARTRSFFWLGGWRFLSHINVSANVSP